MYLQRRNGGRYYFRISVPASARESVGKREICLSLDTTNKKEARLKSLPLIEKYLVEFGNCGCGCSASCSKTSGEKVVRSGFTFKEIYDKYCQERKLRQSSLLNFNTAVNRFMEICGNKDIRLYCKKDITKYKDILLQYPLNLREEDKILSYEKIVKKYKDYSKRISPTTINQKYIALIRTVFNYAVTNDLISVNPALGVHVVAGENTDVKRLPFTLEQIRQNMLSSPLFIQEQDDRKIEYRFLILLGIYTGARLEELCRLRMEDIGEEAGIRFIFIQPYGEHGLKTASSRRRLPIHPALWNRFCFGVFVDQRRRERQRFLFPLINACKEIRGKVGTQFSKWFARWLDSVGLPDKRLCFHSLRHTFKSFGRSSGIDSAVLDCLQGHTTRSVSMDYGKDAYGSPYPLTVLYEELLKIESLNRLGQD